MGLILSRVSGEKVGMMDAVRRPGSVGSPGFLGPMESLQELVDQRDQDFGARADDRGEVGLLGVEPRVQEQPGHPHCGSGGSPLC